VLVHRCVLFHVATTTAGVTVYFCLISLTSLKLTYVRPDPMKVPPQSTFGDVRAIKTLSLMSFHYVP